MRTYWRDKQLGDCNALEKRRGVKALRSSTLLLSVFTRWGSHGIIDILTGISAVW